MKRPISSAPAPISPVRGYPAPPRGNIPLDELPWDYPPSLKANTHLIISVAIAEFPSRTQLAEVCKRVISELRPHFRKAIREGLVEKNSALSQIGELIRYLLIGNCDYDWRRHEIENEVKRSGEWLSWLQTVARTAGRQKYPTSLTKGSNNRSRIDAFIAQVWDQTGEKITRADISAQAGYGSRSELQRFQSEDPRCTRTASFNFNRVLNASPQEFVSKLKRRKKSPTK